jgi:predicted DNA-binding transcriptional regulator YafY
MTTRDHPPCRATARSDSPRRNAVCDARRRPARPLDWRALADETGVGLKTIRRNLQLFRTLACPLEETVSAFGRNTYRMTCPADVPPLSCRLDEAPLYVSCRFLEPLAGTQFWETAPSAFRKIRASLGEPALVYAERMSCFFHATRVGVSDYSQKAKLLDTLTQSIENSRAVDHFSVLGSSIRRALSTPRRNDRGSIRFHVPIDASVDHTEAGKQ